MNNNNPHAAHDTRYEWKTVLLLALGFGLVGLDRWILAPLFPAMIQDLHLSYSQLGTLVGALALTWGAFSILIGNVSDRIGHRAILIPALIIFSLLSGFSGMATSFFSLLLVRGLMGAAEGTFCLVSVAATAEASHPRRRGLNQGLQLSTSALFGFGIAPILATQLLTVVPSWREVYMLVALPGLSRINARSLRPGPACTPRVVAGSDQVTQRLARVGLPVLHHEMRVCLNFVNFSSPGFRLTGPPLKSFPSRSWVPSARFRR